MEANRQIFLLASRRFACLSLSPDPLIGHSYTAANRRTLITHGQLRKVGGGGLPVLKDWGTYSPFGDEHLDLSRPPCVQD